MALIMALVSVILFTHVKTDDWQMNGVKRWFSGRYGYGLMDAAALIKKGTF